MSNIRVAGYVKLAKLWEKKAKMAIPYHKNYYMSKFSKEGYELVDVYIDITGQKEIYKRTEMVRLIRDCSLGKIDCIAAQTRGYLAANTREFCYLIYYLFSLGKDIEILTEDDSYNIDTATNIDSQKEALMKMAVDYIHLNPQDYEEWRSCIMKAIYDLVD